MPDSYEDEHGDEVEELAHERNFHLGQGSKTSDALNPICREKN